MIQVILITTLITVKQGVNFIENVKLENGIFDIFSDNRPCVFPFNYWGVDHDQCTVYKVDEMDNEKVVKFTIYNSCHP